MDHEEARRKHVAGKIIGWGFFWYKGYNMLMTLIQFLLLDHGLSCYASESKVACEGDGSVAMKSYHEALADEEYVSNAMADAATRLTACCVLWSCFCPRREHTRLVQLRYSCTLSRPGFVNVHLSIRRKSISLRSRFTLFPAKKTEICPDLTPDWGSGERRPVVARSG